MTKYIINPTTVPLNMYYQPYHKNHTTALIFIPVSLCSHHNHKIHPKGILVSRTVYIYKTKTNPNLTAVQIIPQSAFAPPIANFTTELAHSLRNTVYIPYHNPHPQLYHSICIIVIII
jgi:hypothetical protein